MAPSSKTGDTEKSSTPACKASGVEIADEGAPGNYECPICLELMVDPVVGKACTTSSDSMRPLLMLQNEQDLIIARKMRSDGYKWRRIDCKLLL